MIGFPNLLRKGPQPWYRPRIYHMRLASDPPLALSWDVLSAWDHL